jgi:hypothetical protein
MAKEAPTIAVSVDDNGGSARAISNDITNLDWSIPRGVQDVTGVDKSAIERILLLADFSLTMNGVFNDDSNLSHAVFKTVASTSVIRTVSIVTSGQTMNNEAWLTDYSVSRGTDGSLTWSVPAVLGDGTAPSWS